MCTLRNAKFSARTRTPTFFRTVPKFGARARKPLFFRAVPKFSVHTSMPIFFCAVSNFIDHKLSTAHHAFLVRPVVHIHLYAHQILVNSIVEIGAFS